MSFLKVLAVLVVSAPVSVFGTFMLMPLWSWIESRFNVEAVGHAMDAGWCFAVTYGAIVLLGLILVLPTRTPSR